jgi:phenylpropionate dioxygenase-like ring-hydroxylating dioxygenase large terminal subunit
MQATTGSLHPDVLAVLGGLDVSDRAINHPAGARVLPKEAYMSPAFHDFEREAVFMHSWLCVGRVQQVPNVGDYMAVTLLDEPLLIVRGKDEKVRAMSALCRHRGHALAEQCTGNAKKFVCPYHRWTYAIDGNLVGAPRMKDAIEIRRLREESQLPLLKTEIWQGFIFVNFDAKAPALAPTLVKLEPYLAGYDLDAMVMLPPSFSKDPV